MSPKSLVMESLDELQVNNCHRDLRATQREGASRAIAQWSAGRTEGPSVRELVRIFLMLDPAVIETDCETGRRRKTEGISWMHTTLVGSAGSQ